MVALQVRAVKREKDDILQAQARGELLTCDLTTDSPPRWQAVEKRRRQDL